METDWRPFINGGIASVVAEIGTFPADMARSKLQVQGQVIDSNYSSIKYNGFIDVLRKVIKEEGFKALYNGLAPAVIRQSVYGTLKFGTYYQMKKWLMKDNESFLVNVICAALGGALANAIANPTDVLKIRMQIQGEKFSKTMVSAFIDICKKEGIPGLYRGVVPTMQRAAIIAAVEIPVYDLCKHYFMPVFGNTPTNFLISSAMAGVSTTLVCTPIDVLRTRIMNQRKFKKPSEATQIYKGMIDCLMKTVKNEGFVALYKGFVPTLFRIGPWNILFFLTYEKLKSLTSDY